MQYIRKNNSLISIMNSSLIDLPAFSNLSHFWSFGSLLGLNLMIQLFSGIFLAMHYSCDINLAFNSLSHILHDLNSGWALRLIHSNGASLFFILAYLHIARSLYYNSYILKETWNSGVIILFLLMAISFLGYVLPWGQMSFWGATVITNLISAVPFIGSNLVIWLWGGFSVNNATLTRFFSLHYLLPFILALMILLHLLFLHNNKSSNPLGLFRSIDKLPFGPYYQMKDFLGFILVIFFFLVINYYKPFFLGDAENFNMANSMVTPAHIQPEWYFLFAYAILRAIPNKLGGVIALFMSIFIFFIFSLKSIKLHFKEQNYKSFFYYFFIINFIYLTWLGMKTVEQPYIFFSQLFSLTYFLLLLFWFLIYSVFCI
uniref:Cytochrome b n=1 Tax=Echiniscus testudo TaxID=399800 RepID=A0A348BR63_ECHTS|nr:cytochrome b [Echiniscus testudo]